MPSVSSGIDIFGDIFARPLIASEAALLEGIRGRMEDLAQEMENYAQENAPWTDRTGAAREGLHTQATLEEGHEYVIVLYGETPENLWLEIAMSQKWGIIRPTLEVYGPRMMQEISSLGR